MRRTDGFSSQQKSLAMIIIDLSEEYQLRLNESMDLSGVMFIVVILFFSPAGGISKDSILNAGQLMG